MNWFDNLFQESSARLADRTSRRSFMARLGAAATGGALLPLLPVSKVGAATPEGAPEKWNDPKSCDYWAYCGIDGYSCAHCGGSPTQCPPGAQPSPIAWVGTCRHPGEGKLYVVSYNDCCGLTGCQQEFCNRNEGDTPRYRPQAANSVTWCYGGVSAAYHCTVAGPIALAE
jgi:methylamine dehydrogenase light chain